VRFLWKLAVIAGALLLAACSADDPEVTTGEPPPPAGGDQEPGDPDAVVLSITDVGGFVPSDRTFTTLPRLLVTGDGRVIQEGPVIAIYPGPLLPNLLQRSITEAGIQRLIDLADEHGLLGDETYMRPGNIADASETIVAITVNARRSSIGRTLWASAAGPTAARRTRAGRVCSTSWWLPWTSRAILRPTRSGPRSPTAPTRT
jgi:hypothetical protein